MKNILFIAGSSEEYYFKPFIDACDGLEMKIYLFDPSDFPERLSLSAHMSFENEIVGFIQGIPRSSAAGSANTV